MLQNDDGSVAEFGNTERGGYGGYEGLGIGNPKSYTASYSQEAMASALAAAAGPPVDWSTQQALENSTEGGMPMGAEDTGQAMQAYTQGRNQLADLVALQNRQNDYKTLDSHERQAAKKAAEAVGMNTDYMGQANKETTWEKILNGIGSIGGGITGGMFGPIGSTLGTHFGGKLGTHIAGARDEEEIMRAAGLLGPVVSPGTGMGLRRESDSLANRIIWPPRMGQRG